MDSDIILNIHELLQVTFLLVLVSIGLIQLKVLKCLMYLSTLRLLLIVATKFSGLAHTCNLF